MRRPGTLRGIPKRVQGEGRDVAAGVRDRPSRCTRIGDAVGLEFPLDRPVVGPQPDFRRTARAVVRELRVPPAARVIRRLGKLAGSVPVLLRACAVRVDSLDQIAGAVVHVPHQAARGRHRHGDPVEIVPGGLAADLRVPDLDLEVRIREVGPPPGGLMRREVEARQRVRVESGQVHDLLGAPGHTVVRAYLHAEVVVPGRVGLDASLHLPNPHVRRPREAVARIGVCGTSRLGLGVRVVRAIRVRAVRPTAGVERWTSLERPDLLIPCAEDSARGVVSEVNRLARRIRHGRQASRGIR